MQAQAGSSEAARELLTHILSHAAIAQETRDRAERLRAELDARLQPAELEAAVRRAQTRTFETVVAENLAPAGAAR